jgi:hypothetical protein
MFAEQEIPEQERGSLRQKPVPRRLEPKLLLRDPTHEAIVACYPFAISYFPR